MPLVRIVIGGNELDSALNLELMSPLLKRTKSSTATANNSDEYVLIFDESLPKYEAIFEEDGSNEIIHSQTVVSLYL